MLIDIGRYFGAFAQNLQASTIHTLDDLWWWRLIGILSVAGLASYYLHIVSLRRPPTWQNACLSVAVFTLPTMQFQAIWVAMYVFWTPPMLLSLAAADLLVRATRSGIPIQLSDHRIFLRRSALWHFAGLDVAGLRGSACRVFFLSHVGDRSTCRAGGAPAFEREREAISARWRWWLSWSSAARWCRCS